MHYKDISYLNKYFARLQQQIRLWHEQSQHAMARLAGRMTDIPMEEWLPMSEVWVGLLCSSFFINLLGLFLPMALLQVYDRIIPNQGISTLILLFSAVTIGQFIELALRILRARISAWADARLSYKVFTRGFRHLLYSDLTSYERDGAGVHMERLGAQEILKDLFGGQILPMLLDLPFVLLYLALMFYIHVSLGVIPIIMMVVLAAVTYFKGQILAVALASRGADGAKRFNFLVEMFSGVHTIKSFGMEEQILRRYERLQHSGTVDDFNFTQEQASSSRLIGFISQTNFVLLVAYGSGLVIDGQITIGALSACTLISGRLMQPIGKLVGLWGRMQAVDLAREKAREIQVMPLDTGDVVVPLPSFKGHIKLENVSFGFGNRGAAEENIIRGVNLEIQPGEWVVITGSGLSGKTTLLSMIAGLLRPSTGTVMMDGVNIFRTDLIEYRRHIGYLPQNGTLFEGTILENINQFRKDAVYEDVLKIARVMGVNKIIEEMPQGYQGKIGHGAVDFVSRGVKQSIILARGLIHNPDIILFDEANTGLDISTDKKVIEYFQSIKGKKTIVMVTGRPSLLQYADKIYRLYDGGVESMPLPPPPPPPPAPPAGPSGGAPVVGGPQRPVAPTAGPAAPAQAAPAQAAPAQAAPAQAAPAQVAELEKPPIASPAEKVSFMPPSSGHTHTHVTFAPKIVKESPPAPKEEDDHGTS